MRPFEFCVSIVDGRKPSLVMVVVLVLFGMTSVAAAQGADREEAARVLELVRTANDAFENEQFQKAYENYMQARVVFPNEAIHYRLGQTAERLNMPFEAVEHYEDYLGLNPSGDAADRIKERLPALKASLPGRLEIDSKPQGAEVFAATSSGPERLGRTPLTVDRAAGEVTLEVSFPEHKAQRKTLSVEAGMRQKLLVELEEVQPGEDESSVTEIKERAPDVVEAVRTPTPVSSQGLKEVATETEGGSLSTIGWSTVGLGAAVLATGGVFSYLQYDATAKVNDYDKRALSAQPRELQGLKDDAISHHRTALISYIAGGVITAGGIGLLVYDGMSKSSRAQAQREGKMRFGAAVDHQSAWFSLSGQF